MVNHYNLVFIFTFQKCYLYVHEAFEDPFFKPFVHESKTFSLQHLCNLTMYVHPDKNHLLDTFSSGKVQIPPLPRRSLVSTSLLPEHGS